MVITISSPEYSAWIWGHIVFAAYLTVHTNNDTEESAEYRHFYFLLYFGLILIVILPYLIGFANRPA